MMKALFDLTTKDTRSVIYSTVCVKLVSGVQSVLDSQSQDKVMPWNDVGKPNKLFLSNTTL